MLYHPDGIDSGFQSTPSAWRETCYAYQIAIGHNISIHSLRMEGDVEHLQKCSTFSYISIHSLRMEGDSGDVDKSLTVSTISIHSLRMEGDTKRFASSLLLTYFNPLPPHGGRQQRGVEIFQHIYFNPLPPHGGRLFGLV